MAHFILLFCREVWPERNEFGTADISPEDEFMALREIFMTSLPSKFIFIPPVYKVYRGYIVFAFSVIMFVCL